MSDFSTRTGLDKILPQFRRKCKTHIYCCSLPHCIRRADSITLKDSDMMNTVLAITAFAFTINLPFGYFRSRERKRSFKWFLYIHLPIPLIVVARLTSHLDYRYIPVFVLASVAGQVCGGKVKLR